MEKVTQRDRDDANLLINSLRHNQLTLPVIRWARDRIESGAHPLLVVGVAQLFLRTTNSGVLERVYADPDGAGAYLDGIYRKQLERAASSWSDSLSSIGQM